MARCFCQRWCKRKVSVLISFVPRNIEQGASRAVAGRAPPAGHLCHRRRAHQGARRERVCLPQRAPRPSQQEIWLFGRPEARRHHQRRPRRLQEGAAPQAQGEADSDSQWCTQLRRVIGLLLTFPSDRRGRGYVQATSLPPHRHDREYLRVCMRFLCCSSRG